jgi:hypothetical protein
MPPKIKAGAHLIWLTIILTSPVSLTAQDGGEPLKWDNQLFLGNKVAAVKGNWKYSGELQVRLKENSQTLDRWYLEGVATYMPSQHWEIVPDYRFSIKSNQLEHRPGFGILRKDLFGPEENLKHQLVHQVKWQADMGQGYVNHGIRYVFFYNYVLNEKLIPNAAAGVFYRWSEGFTGLQFIRLGAGLAYIIDIKHSLNFSYFLGITDTGTGWTYQGIPFVQLIININRDYKYVPAKYINF